jgi:hypothetical protein
MSRSAAIVCDGTCSLLITPPTANHLERDGVAQFTAITPVRRQGFWNQWQLKLRESSAHLVGFIMRRVVCDASAAFRGSFV